MAGLPKHIAIIMDGNGRWATAQGLSRGEGHKAGARTVDRVAEYCRKYGVKYLTLYAFSTENWKRSTLEIKGLWELLDFFLSKKEKDFLEKRIRLHVIGDISALPWLCRQALERVMRRTESFDDFHLTLALNYGGRAELVSAARCLAEKVKAGRLAIEEIKEDVLADCLQTAGIPDPDLMIRTAGEQRLSNFLLWQLSYAEFWFTPVLWPDFAEKDFCEALDFYAGRKRNFGAEPVSSARS